MKAIDFDFQLPESLIAHRPAPERDKCRLLILHKDGGTEHRMFFHLPEYLSEGDMLILNNTKVFPARLTVKKQSGENLEILLVRETEPNVWDILSKGGYTGKVFASDKISGEVFNGKTAVFESVTMENIWEIGQMPLPPYIKRAPTETDKEWYQTVYAERPGSIAAPTAGLHFTKDLISGLERKGIVVRYITHHVSTATFRPIRTEYVKDHTMGKEHFEIQNSLLETINKTKKSGGKIVSVGTTTTRALEGYISGNYNQDIKNHAMQSSGVTYPDTFAAASRRSSSIRGATNLFIYPGYRFRIVDSLITNFHLPRSTPMMLTSALCGAKNLLAAYNCAVSEGYRFFSYGDAMLIL